MTLVLRTAIVAALLGLGLPPALAASTPADGTFTLANVAPPEEPAPPPADQTTPPADVAAPAEPTAPTEPPPPAEATPETTPAGDASAATPIDAPAAAEPEKSGARFLPIIVGLVVAMVVIFGIVLARRKS